MSISPKNCTNFKSRQLARLLTRLYDEELSSVGIRVTQFSLLAHVRGQGPIKLVDLASIMNLETSTLSRNVQALVKDGLLVLTEGPDFRSKLVTLSKTGRAKLTAAEKLWLIAQKKVEAKLGKKKMETLNLLLDDCITILESD